MVQAEASAFFESAGREPMAAFCVNSRMDELVKSQKLPFYVTPAKAGIQYF